MKPPLPVSETSDFVMPSSVEYDERRAAQRIAFCADVPISRWNGMGLPALDCFQVVQARDLSQSGISFFSSSEPPSSNLVLMLGHPKRANYTTARVVRCARVDGQYLIACEFGKRIQACTVRG